MIEEMDKGIGEIIRHLRDNQLLEKTLVFFISDNGGMEGYGDNGILNGAKGSLLEGGHRVPGIVYWKERIIPGVTGEMILSMDIFPTVLSICEIKIQGSPVFDGLDISPLLFRQKDLPERNVFWRYRDQKVVRRGKMKLLISKNDTLLFNLETDISEQVNILKDHPEMLSDFVSVLSEWESEMDAYNQKTR